MTQSRYIPHSEKDLQEMLKTIGISRVEDLVKHLPKDCRLTYDASGIPTVWTQDLEGPLDEASLRRRFRALADKAASNMVNFLGAGWYPHTVPAAVKQVLIRSEFYTAYTPYQPEVSQGTLQAIFEFQSIICELTGCEVANASLYNGASATAEAALMACRVTSRNKILVHRALHPHYRQVMQTVLARVAQIGEIAFDIETGTTNQKQLAETLHDQTAAVVIQNPNFFGCIEDLRDIAALTHKAGALLIVVVTEPLALGILKPPAQLGADIVVGEGGTFGQGPQYGGPGVGFFATSNKYLRNIPGRLCGETVDANGKRGYVLTLSTREQHIRRQKATSNICTNQALCALAFTMTLSLLGKKGFHELARLNLNKLQYLTSRFGERKIRPFFSGATFNERVFGPLKLPAPGLVEELQRQGFIAGLSLGDYFPELPDLNKAILVCTTEENSKSQIESLAAALGKVNR